MCSFTKLLVRNFLTLSLLVFTLNLVAGAVNDSFTLESNNLLLNISEGNVRVVRECNFVLDYNREAHLRTPDIIAKYNLQSETHELQTLDGYSLTMFRIPAEGKPPVFLSHSFACSSRCFLLNCDRRALAIKLADEGFDVWLGNYRGNEYSERHSHLNKNNRMYWNFGIDELASFDAAAMIDYILWKTGQSRVNWVGHGLGSAYILGLLAMKPEFNEKVNLGFMLGSGTGVYNRIPHPVIQQLVPFERAFYWLGSRVLGGNMFPSLVKDVWHRLSHRHCSRNANTQQFGVCLLWQYLWDGYHPGQIMPEVLAMMTAEFPNDMSMKVFAQYLQWVANHKLTKFNYGTVSNTIHYASVEPPHYDLRKVTSWPRTYQFWGENDMYISPEDVKEGERRFPGSHVMRVNDSKWNHFDFILGQDADILIYSTIVDKLKKAPHLPGKAARRQHVLG